MKSDQPTRARKAIYVILVVALALAVRLYQLGHENFWIDEVHQIGVASQTALDIAKNYRLDSPFETHDQAPLSMMIVHFFLTEKHTEFFARLPSAIFGTLGVLAIFVFAREFLSFYPSIITALFLALSPLHVWYSQEARYYSQWSLFATLAYVALVRAEKTQSIRSWLMYGLATSASLYTFVYGVFVTAAQGLSLALRKPGDRQTWRSILTFVGVNLAALIVSAPVVAMVIQRASADKLYSGTLRAPSIFEIPYTFLAYVSGFTVGPTLSQLHVSRNPSQILGEYPEVLFPFLVILPIAALGLVAVFRQPQLRRWVLPWLFVPPISVFLISLILREMTYQVRYTFAAVPAFFLVLAVGVFSLNKTLRWLAAGAILSFSLFSLSNHYWADEYNKADLRGGFRYIQSVDPTEIQLMVVGQIHRAMPYYAREPKFNVIRGCGTEEGIAGEFDKSRSIWLISGRDWRGDTERCLPLLTATYGVADYQSFIGVELWKLEPLPSEE